MSTARTAVVVLNWNGIDDTVACVASLLDQPAGQVPHVIVVDNGSVDGSIEALRSRWTDLDVIELGSNTGFSAGNNAGIRRALELGADVIGIFNNDAVATHGFLEPIDRRVGDGTRVAVSPVIRFRDNASLNWFAGSFWNEHLALAVHSKVVETRPPFYLSGCALFAHRTVWADVGLLDERFFLDFEDVEWSRRAAARGVALEVATDSVVAHGVSRSITRIGGIASYLYSRNGILLARDPVMGAGAGAALRFFRRSVLLPHLRAVRRRDNGAVRSLLLALVGSAHGLRGIPTGKPSTRIQRLARVAL
jgi:GT2 family glycosyltransferase